MAPVQGNKIDPQKYYRDVLSHGVRPDGRSLNEFRTMSVNVKSLHNADGSAIVKIGNTTVVCGIKAELARPKADAPENGYVIINIELPPLCSSLYQPGPPSDHAQEAAKFIDETVKNCNCINLKELCIAANELVWVLHLDIICVNQDGSLMDACMAAAIASLKVVTLPEVMYDAETGTKTINPDVRKKITVQKFPVCTTFAVFENNQILTDPTSEEETLSTGTITIVVEATNKKLYGIHQPGSQPLTVDELYNCIAESQKKTKSVEELITLAIGNLER